MPYPSTRPGAIPSCTHAAIRVSYRHQWSLNSKWQTMALADYGHGKDRGRNDHGKNRGRIQYGVAAGHQPRQYRTARASRDTRGPWPWPRQGPWLGLQPRPSRGTCSAGNAEEFDLGRPSRTARGPRGNGGAVTDDYRQPPRTARTTRRHCHHHRARAKPTSRWERQRGSPSP